MKLSKLPQGLRKLRRGDRRLGNVSMRMYHKAVEIESQELASIYFQDLVNWELKDYPEKTREQCEYAAKHGLLWIVHYIRDADKAKRNFEFYDLWGVYEERKHNQPEFVWLRGVIENEIQ